MNSIIEHLWKDIEITELSNFKTKAFTKYYFEINNLEDLKLLSNIYIFSKENKIWFLIVWWWTNMLFAFDLFNWIIVKNNLNGWNYNQDSKLLYSCTNELISDIAINIENKYWNSIWHRFIGLPWSIWGAIYWNAWCFWLETENNFIEARVLDLTSGQIKKMSKMDMLFKYRNSIIKGNNNRLFLIDTVFDLSNIIEKYSSDVDNIDFRDNKQPKWNTCWSFFKNPNREQSAWYLIESVWLKWFNESWAYFSDLHANFLMNDGTAWYKDIIDLIELAQKKVKKQFDIELINEVRIITNK